MIIWVFFIMRIYNTQDNICLINLAKREVLIFEMKIKKETTR